jgi:hypothetical protein
LGDQTKEDEMGGTCSKHGRDDKFMQTFWSENLMRRDHSEDIAVDGWIILKNINRMRNCGLDSSGSG